MKIVIDAGNLPMGRIASYAAKQALLGNEIAVINSEKAIISGNKKEVIGKYKELRAMGGSALKGPYHSKEPYIRLKRSIRGMLPDYRNGRGREAWKRIKCYSNVPEEFKDSKVTRIKANTPIKNISLQELKEKL